MILSSKCQFSDQIFLPGNLILKMASIVNNSCNPRMNPTSEESGNPSATVLHVLRQGSAPRGTPAPPPLRLNPLGDMIVLLGYYLLEAMSQDYFTVRGPVIIKEICKWTRTKRPRNFLAWPVLVPSDRIEFNFQRAH